MRKEDYHANHNVFDACQYHVVWCPKYRRKVLTPSVDTRLKQIIEEVCQERHVTILALEVMSDHVYLLLDMDPQFGIHRLVRLMKGRSSRLASCGKSSPRSKAVCRHSGPTAISSQR